MKRRRGTAVFDPDPAATVELDKLSATGQLDDFRALGRREVARALEQVGGVVVGHEDRDRVDGVAAGRGAAEHSGEDRAPLAGLVHQVDERVAGDATRGEGQRRLLGLAQAQRRLPAAIGQGSALHLHTRAETPRSTVAQGVEKGIAGKGRQRFSLGHGLPSSVVWCFVLHQAGGRCPMLFPAREGSRRPRLSPSKTRSFFSRPRLWMSKPRSF